MTIQSTRFFSSFNRNVNYKIIGFSGRWEKRAGTIKFEMRENESYEFWRWKVELSSCRSRSLCEWGLSECLSIPKPCQDLTALPMVEVGRELCNQQCCKYVQFHKIVGNH